MDDLGSIEATAAQELVKLLVSGVGAAAKKVPQLWRQHGEAREQMMTEELESSVTALSHAEDPHFEQAKQQERWKAHLKALLREDPGADADLEAVLTELRSAVSGGGNTNVHIGGNVQAQNGGIAIGGVTGGTMSVRDHRDPPRPGRTQD